MTDSADSPYVIQLNRSCMVLERYNLKVCISAFPIFSFSLDAVILYRENNLCRRIEQLEQGCK